MENKIEKIILWGIGIALFVGVIVLINNNGNQNKIGDVADNSVRSESVLMAMSNNFNFNDVSMKDGNVSHEFEVRNDGTETIKINKVYTSCMCTTAYITDSDGNKYGKFGMPGHGDPSLTDIEIEPGKSAIVKATFNPNAHGPSAVGFVQRIIFVETNSIKTPRVELTFQATVTK